MARKLARGATALLLVAACSGGGSAPPAPAVPTNAVPVALGVDGDVATTVTAAAASGAQLVLHPGTRVALRAGGGAAPPPAGAAVALALAAPAVQVPLPAGIAPQPQVRVVLLVDGAEADAAFVTTADVPSGTRTGARDLGAKLVLPVTGTVTPGTLGLLFDLASGTALHVATVEIDPVAAASPAPPGALALAAGPGAAGRMEANVNGTGAYGGGTTDPPPPPAAIPAGLHWTRFAVPDPGCVGPPEAQLCGPSTVDRVAILEPSTAEELGMCWFGTATRAVTAPVPAGFRFYCERAGDGAGGTIVTVSSPQANLPWIAARIVRTSDRTPMMFVYAQPQDGLHLAGGGALADPYARTDLEFAGYKALVFRSSQDRSEPWVVAHTVAPLRAAGYQARLFRYVARRPRGFEAVVDVYQTLDGRARLAQDVVLVDGTWRAVAAETEGNRGTYETEPRLDHLDVDEGAGLLTLHGQFGVTGCEGVFVRFGASRLTPATCAADRITAAIPASGAAAVQVEIGGGLSNAVPLTEWRVRWTATETQGALEYAMGFELSFRADVHDVKVAPGTPGRRSLVPFTCERGARATAAASGSKVTTYPGVTETLELSGSAQTTNLVAASRILEQTGDWLVCEGEVDLDLRRVAWAVQGRVGGLVSRLTTTVDGVTDTQTDTFAIQKGTWLDPSLPDTIPWPRTGATTAAWVIELDATLGFAGGSHSWTHPEATEVLQYQASAAIGPP